MRRSIILVLVFVAVIFGWNSSAKADSTLTISFDELPVGGLRFVPADSYMSLGVVFSRDIPIYSVAAVEPDWWVQKFQAGGGTLPNVMGLSPNVDTGGRTIDMVFVVPGTNIPTTTDFISALFADTEVGSTIGLFEAFDINGNLIGWPVPPRRILLL